MRRISYGLLLGLLMVTGCAAKWPAWVLDPQLEGDMAAADCVPASSSISIDRQQVTANARLALAQQISVKIQAMDKTYVSRVDAGKAPQLSRTFESSSQQSVDAVLNGSRLKKVEYVDKDGAKQLCGLVVLEQGADKRIVQGVFRSAAGGAAPDAETEEILLAKFREKAQSRAQK
jgi:hypothetical protein